MRGQLRPGCGWRLRNTSRNHHEKTFIQKTGLQIQIARLIIFLVSAVFQQKNALENTLAETDGRYSAMLAGYQNQINMLEAELGNMRSSIEQQGQEYKILLDIKTRLENEIATYRGLLDTEDSR